jgi:eukaryotic-like serine/threonine-protein kinase
MADWNERANDIFLRAVDIERAEERQAFLESECTGDSALRGQVDSLLAASERPASFLDRPAIAVLDSLNPAFPPLGEGPGDIIGPYKLLQLIGEGGFGVVYMAEQEAPVRRMVALKIIKPGMDTAQVIARFESERQALALMDHPNIAKVLDAGATESGRPYFVMELVKGITITEFCDRNHMPSQARLKLFIDVCRAIQHAHQKSIIHRDIKPSNVMVTLHDGVPVVKVIDFGVAKATAQKLTARTLFTAYGQMIGTPVYMSPEQAEMSGLDIDTRSDVYSLGVLLYELLTGTTPLDVQRLFAAGYAEMQRLIREEEAIRPSTRLSSLGEKATVLAGNRGTDPKTLAQLLASDLDWIVMKALEKDRNRRYDAPSGLAEDIQRYLQNDAILARPPSAIYRLRKFASRHRVAVLAAFAITGALLLGIVAATWQAVRALRAEAKVQAAIVHSERSLFEALAAKERVDAVNKFLATDLLGQANIGNQPFIGQDGGRIDRNRNVTVGELLDRTAKIIDKRFANQPLIEAAIRLTLGETYMELGRLSEAQANIERSLALRTAELGPDDPDTLTSKNALAFLSLEEGQQTRADRLSDETLAARTARLGPDHLDTLTSKLTRALVLPGNGKAEQAITLLREVVAARSAKLGPAHPDTLDAKFRLAGHSQLKDRKPLLYDVLDAQIAALGDDHPRTLLTKLSLAMVCEATRDQAQAEKFYRELVETCSAKLGSDHPLAQQSIYFLAHLYIAQGEFAKAEPLIRMGAASRQGSRIDHPMTLWFLRQLIVSHQRKGERDQAEPLLRELAERWKKHAGADSSQYALVLSELGSSLLAREDCAEATRILRAALSIEQKGKPDAWSTFHTQWLLGASLLCQKNDAEAEGLLQAGFEGLRRHETSIPLQTKTQLIESLKHVVRLYESLHKPEQAAKWRKELERAGS